MPVTMPGPPPRGTTSVIRVLLRDGTPAPHVAVRIGDRQERTDGDGRARFVGLAGGKIVAVASGRGVVPTAARIDVGGAAEATIHEAASHRVHVEVVDGDGRPLAGAGVGAVSFTVPVSGGDDLVPAEDCVAQYDGDVEMIDVLTGADGRVDVELPSGRHRICAWIGEAFAFVETMSDDVKVVLRRKP
jgi:hypothetical protein